MGKFTDIANSAGKQYANYQKIMAKKAKVEGLIDDGKKLYTAAAHLFDRKVDSSGVLLKLAYEGVERIASLSSNSFIGQYLSYHRMHIDALSGVLVAASMAKFVEKWHKGFDVKASQLAISAREVLRENEFAAWMIDSDGRLARNLPPQFQNYYKALEDVDTRTLFAHQHEINAERDRLGIVILQRARDVSAAYLFFAKEHHEFIETGRKANKMMKKLLDSKGSSDRVAGLAVQKRLMENWVLNDLNDSTKTDDLKLFMNGNWEKTSSYRKADAAIKDLHELASKWNRWAYNVKLDVHLESF